MRFLTGVASGFLGAMNKEMDYNKKEQEDWRKILFRHYTDNVIPQYQKMKLTAMERANKADQYGKLFGNKDLGNLAGNLGDANIVTKLYDISGGPSGGLTNGLGGAAPSMGDDDLQGGTGGFSVGGAGGEIDPSLMNATQSAAPTGGLMGAPAQEPGFWNKMMGTPDRGRIGLGVAKDLGSLYGIDPSQLQRMAASSLNPQIEQLPVNAANLPPRRDPSIEKRLAEWRTYKDDARDPRAFQVALNKFQETKNPKYLEEAAAQIMTYEEKRKLMEKHRKVGGGSSSNANYYRAALMDPLIRTATSQAEDAAEKAKAAGKSPREVKAIYDFTMANVMRKLDAEKILRNTIMGPYGDTGSAPELEDKN